MHKKRYSSSCSSADPGYRKQAAARCLSAIAFVMFSMTASAVDSPGDMLCGQVQAGNILYTEPPEFPEENIGDIDISANKTITDKDGTSLLKGNVIVERNLLRIRSDMATYDNINKQIILEGSIHIDTPGMAIEADQGKYLLEKKQSSLSGISFLIPETDLRGHADTLDSGTARFTILADASVTSCPPDDIDWLLSADSIKLDLEDEYGSAKGVVLRFQSVPILYTPYIEFPIGDKRRSGLLAPQAALSSSRGFELIVPWYWNIAPNQDATLAPHTMRKRGVQLDTNYRYLTRSTSGNLDINYLHHDKITDDKRYAVNYLQQTKLTPNLRFDIDYKDVSDTDYLADFSTSLLGSSTTHLPKSAGLAAGYESWQLQALVKTYETLDLTIPVTNRPYRLLPRLSANGRQALATNLDFTLATQLTDFQHEDDVSTEGQRFNFQPGLELPFRGNAWYVIPAIEYNLTTYNVTDGSGNNIDTGNISIPVSSVDAGLFFERAMSENYIQTLEPRLFYVNIPFTDQNSLPLFDTNAPDFNYAQLFRKNRFNGGDRVGDTNQLTVALESRIINNNDGTEAMRASIGQIVYFDDREITLSGTPDKNDLSDIIADISGTLGNWKGHAGVQRDTEDHRTTKRSASIHYKSGNSLIFNAGYSQRKKTIFNIEELEQTDFSFVTELTNKYTLLGRWNYSLAQERSLETIAGIAYESCCWSMILAYDRHLINSMNNAEEYDDSILLQLVLKGLGSVSGDNTANQLKRSITGYEAEH